MQLFPYQVEGAEFLAQRGRALLADEMGLGKSAQAIAACDRINAQEVVVICPASLVENWKREFKRFSTRPLRPVVRSYNAAQNISSGIRIDVLILDEAHYLKNPKAKRTKAIFGAKCDGKGGLVERAKHIFCLTGTPTPNHPAELWPMLRAVMPDAISPRYAGSCNSQPPFSYWKFVNRYCKTRDNGFGIQITGGKNLDDLKKNIGPYILRRKKEDVLKDLPPIRFDELPLDATTDFDTILNGAGTEQADMIRKALEEDGLDGLKAIAPHVAQLRRLTGLAKVGPVVEWVQEQFDSGLKKLVVFAHHRDVLAGIRDGIDGHGMAMVDGSTQDRQSEVDSFQRDDDCRLFLGQIQAAGTGITLTAASDLLFVESSWTSTDNEQAAMRIHRIGQKNACLVRFATLPGSIDERIQRAVMRKAQDIAKLFS